MEVIRSECLRCVLFLNAMKTDPRFDAEKGAGLGCGVLVILGSMKAALFTKTIAQSRTGPRTPKRNGFK